MEKHTDFFFLRQVKVEGIVHIKLDLCFFPSSDICQTNHRAYDAVSMTT